MPQRTTDEAISLREHFEALLDAAQHENDSRFDAMEKATTTAMAAAEKATSAALNAAQRAVEKAEGASEKRFECVAADTPILCADLTWRPARSVAVGDELIGVDEYTSHSGRRFCRSLVTANSVEQDFLVRVETDRGSVCCNRQHPWLVCRGTWQWVETSELQAGERVAHPADVWSVDTSWRAGWLAGMYDGEGCLATGFSSGKGRLQLSISQRESPTSSLMELELTSRLGRRPLVYCAEPGAYGANNLHRQIHVLVVRRADVMKILGSVRPPRLLARAHEAWEGKVIAGNGRHAIVNSVKDAGMGEIALLSTTTRTYIAGGFAMHNSVNEFRGAMNDAQRILMPRAEAEARFAVLAEKIDSIASRLDRGEGRSGGLGAGWGYLVGAAGLVAAIIAIFVALSN